MKRVLTRLFSDEDVPNAHSPSSSALTETTEASVQNVQEAAILSATPADGNVPGNSLRVLVHFLTLRMQIHQCLQKPSRRM